MKIFNTFQLLSAILLLASFSMIMLSCSDETEMPVPVINSFSPTSAWPGATVTISGNNFSIIPMENYVTFNGIKAMVVDMSVTQLVVIVPATATTGKIKVTVTGATGTSTTDFTVLYPSFTAFSPASGMTGTSVTITGTNFSTIPSENIVKFNGVAATVTSATATTLVVTVPEAATGKITVTTKDQTVTSATDFTVLETTITGISPESGWVGTPVTITGANFSTTLATNVVKFNGVPATVTSASATTLVATVPEGATTGKIEVTIGAKTTRSSTDFAVLQTTISSLDPAFGTFGTTVNIIGTNFSITPSANTVMFNGAAATVSAATSTQLTVTVPADATTGKISVTIDGTTITSDMDFIVPLPTITDYFPPIAAAGVSVTIAGSGFSSIVSNNIVQFNGASATVTAASSTQLMVTVPAGATTGLLSVKVGESIATSSDNFEICSGSAELVISDVVITNNSNATSYNVSFKVTNAGSASADLTKIGMQNYASTDNAVGGDVAASGFSLSTAPTLSPGQSYTTPNYSCNIVGGTTTSHPFLIITLYDFPDGDVPECNVANNIVINLFD